MKSELTVDCCGFEKWYNEKGQHHREDGPAIKYPDGTKKWYINGNCHRLDGPAVEWINGDKEWWINGKRHRIDGPAVELSGGRKWWFYHGQRIICQSQEEFERIINLLIFE